MNEINKLKKEAKLCFKNCSDNKCRREGECTGAAHHNLTAALRTTKYKEEYKNKLQQLATDIKILKKRGLI